MRTPASERGAVAPASLLAAAVVAVAIGTAGYAMTSGPSERVQDAPATSRAAQHAATPKATVTRKPQVKATPTAPPVIDRGSFNLAIYNDSNIRGLAARTSTKAQTFGWKVVTTSQWYGTVDTSTVYYPPKMKDAAQQLAKDLGIATIKPAVSPMQMDQLTVILTSTYGG
ncbi:MAG: LytR C-terminal domain-containing protein [Marmoricola sp.]